MSSQAAAAAAGQQQEEALPEGVLAGKGDLYDGVTVDVAQLPKDAGEFGSMLDTSLQYWEATGRRGIWLKLPITAAHLVPVAVERDFEYHHAEKEYVMLTRWLPDSEDKLPPNASHQVGVGALVVNERREVLVVLEKSGPLRGTGVWKMPTGLVTQGEDITDAAAREVLEETGIHAAPHRVLAMRQAHGFTFSKSDLFFVVALRPEPGQGNPVPQEDEIEEAKWMPLEEYANLDFLRSRTLLRKMTECCVAYADGDYTGWGAEVLDYGPDSRRRVDLFVAGQYGPGAPADAGAGSGSTVPAL